MSMPAKFEFIPSGAATALLPTGGNHKPITVIGTEVRQQHEALIAETVGDLSNPSYFFLLA